MATLHTDYSECKITVNGSSITSFPCTISNGDVIVAYASFDSGERAIMINDTDYIWDNTINLSNTDIYVGRSDTFLWDDQYAQVTINYFEDPPEPVQISTLVVKYEGSDIINEPIYDNTESIEKTLLCDDKFMNDDVEVSVIKKNDLNTSFRLNINYNDTDIVDEIINDNLIKKLLTKGKPAVSNIVIQIRSI